MLPLIVLKLTGKQALRRLGGGGSLFNGDAHCQEVREGEGGGERQWRGVKL